MKKNNNLQAQGLNKYVILLISLLAFIEIGYVAYLILQDVLSKT